jgi:hypothetical protein
VTADVPPQHLVHGISQCLVLEDRLDVAGRHVAETNGRTVLDQRAPEIRRVTMPGMGAWFAPVM